MQFFSGIVLRQNLRSNLKFLGWKKGDMENFGGSPVSFAACDCEQVHLWAGGLVELKTKFLFLVKETAHSLQSSALPRLTTLPLRWNWYKTSPSKFHRIFLSSPFPEGSVAGWIKEGNVLLGILWASCFHWYQYSTLLRVLPGSVLREWYQNLVPISNEIKWSLKSDSYCRFIYSGVLGSTAATSWV